ncbi:MAG: SDR family oxidoreductase [Wenzhouxiangella sp.]
MKKLLIAGCGDLGTRLAARLAPKSWAVHGLRRRVENLPPAVRPVAADLLDPATLSAAAGSWDAVIYQATPGERSPEAYRATYLTGLNNLLAVVEARRLIFVSSTAVYGQDLGEWVDEDSPTQPQGFSGQLLLAAEQLAHTHGGIVVRFSGIYGPGRDYLIRALKTGRARCRRDPPQWTNRIHADDCAAVLAHLLDLNSPRSVYCASDNQPAPRCVVLGWLADQLGLPAPLPEAEAAGQGKRVANRRLTSSGFTFQYPDFQTGYRTLLSCPPR